MNIENTTALVTGGASGLGRATASALADAGATVVVLDRPGSNVDTRFVAAEGDVADEESVRDAVDAACAIGDLRVVVNCAGIAPAAKLVRRDGTHDLRHYERVLRVNLIGTINVMAIAAEAMSHNPTIDGERGVVINTSSVAAFDGQIGQVAYAASKGGVAALTLPAARELARHLIRVAAIAPGIFETPMTDAFDTSVLESLGAQVPHPSRLGRAQEFAALVLHIASNSYLNGTVIRLDGAIRMPPT